jgi:hypothetical protein
MSHKFKVGQLVELEPSVLRSLATGPYEIRHLIPSSDRDPNDPIYRIKSAAEKHERVAPESELMLSASVFA